MTKNTLKIFVLLICMSACSQKSLYTNIQKNQRNECLKLPDSEQKSCLSSTEMDYDEYQRQREALKNSTM